MEKWFPAGLVLAGILVAVLGFTMFQRMQAGEIPAAEPAPAATGAPTETSPPSGAVQKTVTMPILKQLSPETRVAAERFRCICGCPDVLSKCTCTKVPGSITMKNYLQDLVDRKLSNEAIDRAMIEKYGEEVLLFLPDSAGAPGG
jgi:hypothetical protein